MRCFIYIILFNLMFLQAFAQEKPLNLLSSKYSVEKLNEIVVSKENWHPFPKAGDVEGWSSVPKELQEAYIQKAEENLNFEWPQLTAVRFLDYVRNGNRSNYTTPFYYTREMLNYFVLAESMENKGRFMDDIINGIWAICEESFWGIPAHIQSGLPDVNDPIVDLFAAETANLLAWTVYFLEDKLDSISPLITERIYNETERRVLTPNFERNDFWWMGFGEKRVNNWNPWINSNWLAANLLLERDETRRIQATYKILQSLDVFLNSYPADGGCDEGPGYWGKAGGALFLSLELLENASGGKINVFNESLIKNIGTYIYKVYINYPYYINFADSSAINTPDPGLIFRFGEKVNDEDMMSFAAFLANKDGSYGKTPIASHHGAVNPSLFSMFALNKIQEAEAEEPLLFDFWLPDIQVMGARAKKVSSQGFYLAAKGGHNDESHNHNDVGNFIVYYNGQPCFVDAGVETYSAKTFNEHRYEIWTMQSAYHSLPTINGVMQKEGRNFKAENVQYNANSSQVNFSLDIAKAYPEEAKIEKWEREISFIRDKKITISESFKLEEAIKNNELNFLTALEPKVLNSGEIALQGKGEEDFTLYMNYSTDKFNIRIEPIEITDARLFNVWGDQLTRVVLEAKQANLTDNYEIEIIAK